MAEQKQFTIRDVRVTLEPAPDLYFPSATDCNSPCWWQDDQLFILNATGHPVRSQGSDLEHMQRIGPVTWTAFRDGGRWIESVYPAGDGRLFGWYHNEPHHYIPGPFQVGRIWPMTAPFIGAVVSYDNGASWDDLGLILTGGPDSLDIENRNFFFAGGNGDFSVILDRQGTYLYFLFGTYYKDAAQQGVCLARMHSDHLQGPVGQVMKWHDGAFGSPGLNGPVSPLYPVRASWYSRSPDAHWGPSVHWNTTLEQYVILMNRAIDPNWKQDGIYIILAPDLADPAGWSEPTRIIEGGGWYPQVVGLDHARQETDREAGALSRLYVHGKSEYYLRFEYG
jgi:hypothetical protein